MKKSVVTLGLTFIIILALISFSYFELKSLFFGLFAVLTLILVLKNHNLILKLFLIFLPTNDIFTKEDFLFSFLGLKQILAIGMILYFFKNRRIINNRLIHVRSIKNNENIINFFSTLFGVLIIYFSYTYFKSAFFGLHEFDFQMAVLKSINMSGYLFACILALKAGLTVLRFSNVKYLLISSLTLMLVFSFLSPYLQSFGFKSIGTEESEFASIGIERFAGIIADGDSNTLSIFVVMSISICLLFFTYSKNLIFAMYLFPLTILVAITGSRTGLIGLIIILVVFFLFVKNRFSEMSKFYILLLLPVIVIISVPYFELVFNRFLLIGEQFEIDTGSNRIGKWILYFNFFFDHKETFLTGAQKELLITWDNKYYAAHNAFVTMIYNSGVIFSFAVLLLFLKMIITTIKQKGYDFMMLLLPVFILINTVSDLGIIYTFLAFTIFLTRSRTHFYFQRKYFTYFLKTKKKLVEYPKSMVYR
jgi:hypothetical protein